MLLSLHVELIKGQKGAQKLLRGTAGHAHCLLRHMHVEDFSQAQGLRRGHVP